MKKLFLVLTCLITLSFAAFSQNNSIPREITEMMEGLDRGYQGLNKEPSFTYLGTKIEGNNIVSTLRIDENKAFEGMSLTEGFALINWTEESISQMMYRDFFGVEERPEVAEDIKTLRTYKYNLVFHIIGTPSGEEMECKVSYWELPDVK